ncbi:hypothetical protein C0992_010768 [Termitomyces sp. T32_za158]|nr:hypothetical protein C0992_010768 [Termitomyces sp. T32_za158]
MAAKRCYQRCLDNLEALVVSKMFELTKMNMSQMEYAFLADFDLLSDTREDVRKRPWAVPAACIMMDEYFKILCAWEEINQLNVEIQRLVTYIHDEEAYLQEREKAMAAKDTKDGERREEDVDIEEDYTTLETVKGGHEGVEGGEDSKEEDSEGEDGGDDDNNAELAEQVHKVIQISSDL